MYYKIPTKRNENMFSGFVQCYVVNRRGKTISFWQFPFYMINDFGFSLIILLLFKAWVIFLVFPMLRLHKRKPHTYTLMLIFSQVSDFIFKQFLHKQPSIDVLTKWCLENMQQVYRRTPMPKFDSIKFQQLGIGALL